MLGRLDLLMIVGCLLLGQPIFASNVPKKKPVHIELRYQVKEPFKSTLNSRRMPIVPYSYFTLHDIYSNVDEKVGSEALRDGVTALDFEINHPLYDYIETGGSIHIPFYVEPGDSLFIYVTKVGRVIKYECPRGKEVKCRNLLLHDFSNSILYDESDFNEDKKDARFPEFVRRVISKMDLELDSVRRNADRYGFNDVERRVAMNNVKLQFALWLFEFTPYKNMELNLYSARHKEGWQATQSQDNDYADIMNVDNYSFIKRLPLNDSTCFASRFFSQFMMSYEHSQFLNSDQYLYYGKTKEDAVRMDSAFVAKDIQLTGQMQPSLFMDLALQRKHYVPPVDDGSIKLKEVQVIGTWKIDYPGVTERDMLNFKLNSKPTYNALSPSYWLYDRKREKAKKRAKDLIRKIEEAEELERLERDAIMKAYEDSKKEE